MNKGNKAMSDIVKLCEEEIWFSKSRLMGSTWANSYGHGYGEGMIEAFEMVLKHINGEE